MEKVNELINQLTGAINSENISELCFKDGRLFTLKAIPTHVIFAINNPVYGQKFMTLTKEEFNKVLLEFSVLSGHQGGYAISKNVTSARGNDYEVELSLRRGSVNDNNGNPAVAYILKITMSSLNDSRQPSYSECLFYKSTFEKMMLTAASDINQSHKIQKIEKILDIYKKTE